MKKILLLATFTMILVGCKEESIEVIDSPEPVSLMTMNVTANSLAIKEADTKEKITGVYISINSVEVKQEGNWLNIPAEYPFLVNLLNLKENNDFLSVLEMEPGLYTEMRLYLAEGNDKVTIEGKGNYVKKENGFIYPLKIPSGSSSGFKLKGSFEVKKGQPHQLMIDFNVEESIVKQGKKDRYLLKPVAHIETNHEIGFIYGQLNETFPKAKYKVMAFTAGKFKSTEMLSNNDQVLKHLEYFTTIKEEDENFIIPIVENGSFDIVLQAEASDTSTGKPDHITTDIKVKKGEIKEIQLKQ